MHTKNKEYDNIKEFAEKGKIINYRALNMSNLDEQLAINRFDSKEDVKEYYTEYVENEMEKEENKNGNKLS